MGNIPYFTFVKCNFCKSGPTIEVPVFYIHSPTKYGGAYICLDCLDKRRNTKNISKN